ncbi:LysR family transcriptional regulator [Labrys miyagiensis]|uniref:LysR family transcriptional regulator n=1 Tax=Labrys miyagiensis TaxID=346912 RepID=A0ABQ6CQ35_9HYPH|nr:LysR family transcriptional regulator [Labrys miyagiensis]GLS22466.1 LysR family transcriptional regulator [Labrys miyagiensis]
MARSDSFDGLSEFLAIVRQGSFRAAAIELGVTAGAVSQALQVLERRLGLPLLHRTTRKISLTEAGERLLAQLAPAADAITTTLDELTQSRARPSGTLRLLVQRVAIPHVVTPIMPDFRKAWPDLKIEITVEDSRQEIVAGGFDAGIRIGEYIDRDMVAVRVSPSFNWLVMGAPSYLAAHGRPQIPEDIAQHECIRYRRPDFGDVYRWEFEREGQALSIDPPGSLVVSDPELFRALAVEGLGLIYTSSLMSARELAAGQLEPVLEAFSPSRDAFFIYFPRTSRNQPKLRAFVEACARGAR